MRQFVAAKALYRTEPVGKHQLFYLLDGVDRHIKRPHPQFVSLWRCQFVANDEPSSLPQHSVYLTESNVDIIPKIDGLESGNNIKHFVVERYCRYICFVYFRPLLCYRAWRFTSIDFFTLSGFRVFPIILLNILLFQFYFFP